MPVYLEGADRTPVHVTSLVKIVALLEQFEAETNVNVCFWLTPPPAVDGKVRRFSVCLAPNDMQDNLTRFAHWYPPFLATAGRFVTEWDPSHSTCQAEGREGLGVVFDEWAFDGGHYIERSHRDRAYAILARSRSAGGIRPL